jgi:hypothetical protein
MPSIRKLGPLVKKSGKRTRRSPTSGHRTGKKPNECLPFYRVSGRPSDQNGMCIELGTEVKLADCSATNCYVCSALRDYKNALKDDPWLASKSSRLAVI